MTTDYMNTLSGKIEEEYQAWLTDKNHDKEKLFVYIREYIRPVVAVVMKGKGADQTEIESVCQDALIEILVHSMERFEKKNALFASYCWRIAKNKAVDWVRNPARQWEEWSPEGECVTDDERYQMSSPEHRMLKREQEERIRSMTKEYLDYFTHCGDKVYRMVANSFSILLFALKFPDAKELSSPKWAYGELEESNVSEGARQAYKEVNGYLDNTQLRFEWGEDFCRDLNKVENRVYQGGIIYGEHFKEKDFENWSLRFRKKMRTHLANRMEELEL